MTILSKIVSRAFGGMPSFWMRDIHGRPARIVNLSQKGRVCYVLNDEDNEHVCSVDEWQRLPIWHGRP